MYETRNSLFHNFVGIYISLYTEDAGSPYFDRAAVIANGTWLCGSALKSMGAKLCFRSCLVNIGPSFP